MSCDNLFDALGEIRDAINNQQLSISLAGVESRLQGIETAISNQQISVDTSGIETALNALQSIADRVDDLGTDLGLHRDELSAKLLNLASYVPEELASRFEYLLGISDGENVTNFSQFLKDLQISVEQMRLYEGIKLDFYGQTMTTQSGLIQKVVDALNAQQMEFTVIAQKDFDFADQSPVSTIVTEEAEIILNALTVHTLYHKSLLSFVDVVPDAIIYPASLKQAIQNNIIDLALASIVKQGIAVVEVGARLAETAVTTGIPWSWQAIADEWDSYQQDWICYILDQDGTQLSYEDQQALITNFISSNGYSSSALINASTMIGSVDLAAYILGNLLGGDKSLVWRDFFITREQLRDGFDPEDYNVCQ